MSILQKFKNPLIWISGFIFKLTLRLLFFKNLSNNDFKRLLSYTLELLPNETFFNIFKLMLDIFKSKPTEILNFKLLNDAVTHSIPQEKKLDILGRLKYLFLFLTLWNILKRSLFLVKSIIIWPFKLGVYSFIASLFGIRPDYFLSFFEIFKFNLPSWTYQKLVELHISWMTWLKNILQIKSINTEIYNPDSKISLPKLFSSHKDIPIIEPEIIPDPDTYLYLTKTQWFYVSISIAGLLAAYFGYTGGIPFTKGFDWESKSDDGSDTGGDIIIGREGLVNQTRPKTWTESIKSTSSNLLNKLNPFSWRTVIVDREELEFEIQEKIDSDRYKQFKAQEAAEIKEYEAKLRGEEKRERKMSEWYYKNIENNENIPQSIEEKNKKGILNSILSMFWKSPDEIQIERLEKLENIENIDIKKAQLEKLGHLGDQDRAELRKEYSESKFTSPTHSDPEVIREYNHLFPKPDPMDNSSQSSPASPTSIRRKPVPNLKDFLSSISSSTKSSLYSMEDVNDSTDTIRPSRLSMSRTETNENTNLSPDITASELTPLTNPEGSSSSSEGSMVNQTEEIHTYPPRSFKSGKIVNYYEGQPFVRGFQENLDQEIKIKKSFMFSANFLDRDKKQ